MNVTISSSYEWNSEEFEFRRDVNDVNVPMLENEITGRAGMLGMQYYMFQLEFACLCVGGVCNYCDREPAGHLWSCALNGHSAS